MLELFLSYLVTFGVRSNVMVANTSGVLLFQREKMYRSFRYLNALLLVVGVVICSVATYFLNKFVLTRFSLEYLKISFAVLLACLYNLLVSKIWYKSSTFGHYLYESTYSYAFDTAYIISIVLLLDLSLPILNFMLMIAAIVVVIIVMTAVVGFYVESSSRGYMNVHFRSVPAILFVLTIIAIILHYAGLLVK